MVTKCHFNDMKGAWNLEGNIWSRGDLYCFFFCKVDWYSPVRTWRKNWGQPMFKGLCWKVLMMFFRVHLPSIRKTHSIFPITPFGQGDLSGCLRMISTSTKWSDMSTAILSPLQQPPCWRETCWTPQWSKFLSWKMFNFNQCWGQIICVIAPFR